MLLNVSSVTSVHLYVHMLRYRNLKYIRQWYQFYNEQLTIGQQVVAQLDDVNVQQLVAQIQDKDFKKG